MAVEGRECSLTSTKIRSNPVRRPWLGNSVHHTYSKEVNRFEQMAMTSASSIDPARLRIDPSMNKPEEKDFADLLRRRRQDVQAESDSVESSSGLDTSMRVATSDIAVRHNGKEIAKKRGTNGAGVPRSRAAEDRDKTENENAAGSRRKANK